MDDDGGVSEGAVAIVEAVRTANQAFYDAHENRDIDAMAEVWLHHESVVCIHPGWPILRGWSLVEQSWRQILEGPGRNQFVLTNDAIQILGDVAIVTLDENLLNASASGTIAATNVYRYADGGWKLTLHHGSPVATR